MEHLFDLFKSKHHPIKDESKRDHVYPDTKQGLEYLHAIRAMCSSMKTSLVRNVKETSTKEGFENALERETDVTMDELNRMESRFNHLLSEYSTIYNNYAQNLKLHIANESSKQGTKDDLAKVDTKDKDELVRINDELLQTANNMYEKIQELQQKISKTNELSDEQEMKMHGQLDKYNHLYRKMKDMMSRETTFNAMLDDATTSYKSYNLQFIVWSVITGLLILYTIKQLHK